MRMNIPHLLLLSFALFLQTDAFSPRTPARALKSVLANKPDSFLGSPLHLSGDKNDEGDEPRQSKRKRDMLPFFGRFTKSKKENKEVLMKHDDDEALVKHDDDEASRNTSEAAMVTSETQATALETQATASETQATASETQATASETQATAPTTNKAAEMANTLRAQAERVRLEAERMDVKLTLDKIEKFELKLVRAKTKGEPVDDLQLQLDNLQAKLRGEAPKSRVAPVPTLPDIPLDIEPKAAAQKGTFNGSLSTMDGMFGKDFDETLTLVQGSPAFIRKLVATLVECDFNSIDDLNSTEVARRITMMNSGDYSYSNLPKPAFTQSQIDEAIVEVEKQTGDQSYPKQFIELASGNVTKLALYSLEYKHYISSRIGTDKDALDMIVKVGEGEEWMKPLLEAINQTAVDRSIETLFPKCMRKEGIEEPTMAQVQLLVANVLPEVKFASTAKAEKVLGGYVIRGSHKYETANQLIDAIDKELSKANLADKMTVFYSPDFTIYAQVEEDGLDLDFFDPDEQAPILYVTAPDITVDRQRVLLSITSAFGLATSWYLSLYPFLLNPDIAKRVEDQLALADASMAYNLDWLTELSVPLFVSFLGIQLSHELAHRAVAASYGMNISFPTIVPSLITGTTSSVTTFKEPPKNREAMFDFALAGPLTGILASLVAITVGAQLTLTSDPSTLPALPLEILRQSTLGGGIIDGIVKGSLYVPDGAPMSGILISLHPLAIAGYFSLVVNALGLLPVGTTDGGRIGLTLFGRPLKLVVGNLFLFTLLLAGLLGSDLYLFYFSFVIAFQTGNEIPCRDETANISFPRVIAAILAYCLVFLSLVPFQ